MPRPANANDTITLQDLEVWYRVGVTAKERRRPQRLLITLELETNHRRAAASDKLVDTIDYFALSEYVRNLGKTRQWNLIETVAVEIAEHVVTDPAVAAVSVEVKKFVLRRTAYVSVRTTRVV